MKRTFKKSLALLLTLIMVLSLAPAMSLTAGAAADDSWVGADSFDSTVDAKGSGWSWVAEAQTLTLSGVNVTATRESSGGTTSGIYITGDAKILLEGANRVAPTAGYGIYCTGSLTIEGSGTLEVTALWACINAVKALTINSGYLVLTSSTDEGIYLTQSGAITVNGGYAEINGGGSSAGITLFTKESSYLQTGGVVKVNGGSNNGRGIEFVKTDTSIAPFSTGADTLTVSGGYLEVAGSYAIKCSNFSNTGGVVKAVGSTYGISAYKSDETGTASFTGGVTIASGSTNGISATMVGGNTAASGELLWISAAKNGVVSGSGAAITTTNLAKPYVVIAKTIERGGGYPISDGSYIFMNEPGDTLSFCQTISGGNYLEATSNVTSTTPIILNGTTYVGNSTLVCITKGTNAAALTPNSGGGTDEYNQEYLTVGTGGTLYAYSEAGTGVNIQGADKLTVQGQMIGVGATGGVLAANGKPASVSGGYLCGVSTSPTTINAGISTTSMTVTGGYVTAVTESANITGLSYASTMEVTGDTAALTAIGAGMGASNAIPSTSKVAYASAKYSPLIGTGDASAKVVRITKLPPEPSFDARNGDPITNERPATAPVWNDYTFAGWYTGIDGTGEQLLSTDTPKDGQPYYAKWTRSIEYMTRTVITTPLDFTGSTTPTLPEKCGIELWVGDDEWDGTGVWAGDWINITGTIDCSNTTDCEYALKLPAGVTINSYSSIIKAGSKDGKSVGIQGAGALTITAYNSTLDVTAANVTGGSFSTIYSYGINATQLTIEGNSEYGGTVSVIATAGTSMKTDGATSVDSTSAGVNTTGTVTIQNGGSLTATGKAATGSATMSSGVYTNVSVTGGSLNATGVDCGVYGTAAVTGGSLTAYATGTGNSVRAIRRVITTTGTVKAGDNETAGVFDEFTSPSEVTNKYVNIAVPVSYPVWLAGVQLNENNVDPDTGAVTGIAGITGGTVTYTPADDYDDAKLTLSGTQTIAGVAESFASANDVPYKVADSHFGAGIYAKEALVIDLAEDANIAVNGAVVTDSGLKRKDSVAVFSTEALTIQGSGKLTANGAAITTDLLYTSYSGGIASTTLTIKGDASVTANGGDEAGRYGASFGVGGNLSSLTSTTWKYEYNNAAVTVNGGSLTVFADAGFNNGVNGILGRLTATAGTFTGSIGRYGYVIFNWPITTAEGAVMKANTEMAVSDEAYDPDNHSSYRWIRISYPVTYPVWLAGVQLTENNVGANGAVTIEGVTGVTYTAAESNTPAKLTLSGTNTITGTTTHYGAGIYAEQSLTIDLESGADITVNGAVVSGSYSDTSAAIICAGALTMQGSGALTANGADVTVTAPNHSSGSMGIAAGSLAVTETASVTANGGNTSGSPNISYGVAGCYEDADGINIGGIPSSVSVSGGRLTAAAGAFSTGSPYSSSNGICGNLTVTAGAVTVSGDSSALQSGRLTASGATVKAGDAAPGTVVTAYTDQKWVNITFGPSISISTQPESPAAMLRGSVSGSLSVVATATGNKAISYQWYQNTTASATGGTAISGATGTSYTIPTTLAKGVYYYYCVLKATGCADVTSSVATITVNNPTGNISGIVEKNKAPVPGATVKLMQGDEQIDTVTTTDDGAYNFKTVEYGVYSVVVTTADGKTVTIPVTLDSGSVTSANVEIPNVAGNQNTVVETEPNTPSTAADMNKLFNSTTTVIDSDEGITNEDKEVIADGGTVELKLTAKGEAPANVPTDAAKITALSGDGDANYLYVDLTVEKTVTPSGGTSTVTTLKELNEPIAVNMEIPEAYQRSSLRIFRIHEGIAEELPRGAANKNAYGEYFELNADYSIATLYIKRFSTFALSIGSPTSGPTRGGGYEVNMPTTPNGTIKVSPDNAAAGDTVTVTVTPDKGYTLETLTVTKPDGSEVPLTKNSDGTFTFTMPDSDVTIKASFMEDNTMLNYFVDVSAGAYYYDAVLWAANNKITEGTSATTFSPDAVCTRAQMVTFLWRAMGSPEPASAACPFVDVASGSYYYKAVLWAAEKGITDGTSATTFSPNETVTRAQVVTLQWRAAGKPASAAANPFVDVASGTYYEAAVLWAVAQRITEGTSTTTFSPLSPCTRAQIVTFLYRQLGK